MVIVSDNFIENPLVSVVLCAMNRESTIGQTIDCILAQKCNFSFELIIGEDCGTDRTREICLDYQRRNPGIIKLHLHKENCGLGKNWAFLVKEARGKYVASCDDDDYWHNPFKLQLQVDYLEKHPDCGMVHTEKDVLNVKSNKITDDYYQTNKMNIPQGHIMLEIFTGKAPICVSTSIIRKELIDKYVPLDDYIRNKYHIQDWQTWIILAKYSKIDFLPISTTTYRVGYESVSNPLQYERIEKRFATERQMYKSVCEMFPEDLVYNETAYTGYVNNILLNLAFKKSDYLAAKKYAFILKESDVKNVKIMMAQNRLTFYLFTVLKQLRKSLNTTRHIHFPKY